MLKWGSTLLILLVIALVLLAILVAPARTRDTVTSAVESYSPSVTPPQEQISAPVESYIPYKDEPDPPQWVEEFKDEPTENEIMDAKKHDYNYRKAMEIERGE